MEIFGSLKYYSTASRSKLQHRRDVNTREGKGGPRGKMDFGAAFGVYQPRAETDKQSAADGLESGYDEAIRLAPYGYQEDAGSPSPDPSVGA